MMTGASILTLLCLLLATSRAAYLLKQQYDASNFLDGFDFRTVGRAYSV